MSRKAWLNPRKNKLIAPTIRTTKDGVQIVKSHEHEYPNKLKPTPTKKDKNNEKEIGKRQKNKKNERLTTSKRKENLDSAKKEMACRMGA